MRGAQLSNGTWVNNNISGLSSGGITQSGRTPDLAAPGDSAWALCTPDLSLYEECSDDNGNPASIQNFGGTSQSSPLTAGAAALVIEAYENSHHGVRPSPAVVKQILTSTATDLGHPAYEQGAGLLEHAEGRAGRAELAGRATVTRTPTGSALVVDKTQLFSASYPNLPAVQSLTVTNVGDKPQKVSASTRTLGRTVSDTSGTAAINTATAPAYIDAFGIPRSYTLGHSSRWRKNVDRLTMWAAAPTAPFSPAGSSCIDPSGAYTAYSIPQGAANFAMSRCQVPGGRHLDGVLRAVARAARSTGTSRGGCCSSDFTTDGIVVPSSFTLAPGASRRVTVISREPSQPGDISASVQFDGSVSGVTSVPFSLRAVVPPRDNTFTGTVTGGNGRGQLLRPRPTSTTSTCRGASASLGVGVLLGDPGN